MLSEPYNQIAMKFEMDLEFMYQIFEYGCCLQKYFGLLIMHNSKNEAVLAILPIVKIFH